MDKKIRITVLRTEFHQDLADQYAIPDLGMCPFHQEGRSSGVTEHIRRKECAK